MTGRPPGLATWVIVRVTGLLLAVLVLGHRERRNQRERERERRRGR
jgi:hypothetical protein